MRTKFAFAIALSLGLMLAMFAGSGFNALVQGDQADADQLSDKVNASANESSAGQGEFSGDRSGNDDSSIIGLVVSGARSLGQIVGIVAFLPKTLVALGFPRWFTVPIGWGLTLLLAIGVIQFATGRTFE